MHINNINKLINLKGVLVKNIIHYENLVEIYIETKPRTHKCPNCGLDTRRVHDYRTQRIKDLPFQLKHVILVLRKRRYACLCGKRFYEELDFIPRYHRMTCRLIAGILKELRENYSMTSIANRLNLSISTISRVLDYVSYSIYKLPTVLSIDEFKGNSGGSKYHCILVDPVSRQVLDILKDRKSHVLSSYFKNFENRSEVKYFVTDMWRPYVDIAKTYFKNATIIIDKYHFVRMNNWAIENVRKRIQKTMDSKLRKYYKRSKRLILAKYEKLDYNSRQEVDVMLLYNEDLRRAHSLKERFYKFSASKSSSEARELLKSWIDLARSSDVKEYISCANSLANWFNEICNSFDVPYTNGPTEGFNNKIKVIKRNAFGFRNFNRFRNRILHCCQN